MMPKIAKTSAAIVISSPVYILPYQMGYIINSRLITLNHNVTFRPTLSDAYANHLHRL